MNGTRGLIMMTEREIMRYAYKGVLNDILKYEEKCEKWDVEIDRNLHIYKDYNEISEKIKKIDRKGE
jgi:hypothetical protein